MKKAIVFLADGMADDSLPELNGLTPLEAANTPMMDMIAKNGINGTFLTLPPDLPTSSDVANMSVLGFYPEKNYPGRGPIEAASQMIKLAPDDVAWRCNLVYASDDGVLRDYSAGHIDNSVSARLMNDLQREFGNDKVTFYAGVSYRNLLVLHGREFSNQVLYNKPDASQDMAVADLRLKAADDSREAVYTAKFLTELEDRCAAFLRNHPLNASAESPANRIWLWSPGYKPVMKPFTERYGCRGAIISAVDVIKGLGRCTGMEVIDVPGATGFIDSNFAGKASAAIKAIEEYDFVYLHVEMTDECSHLGDLKLKMQAIELMDSQVIAPVLNALSGRDINFAILPDHPVPVNLRCHTRTPVPVAIMGRGFVPDNVMAYSEKLAPTGALGFKKGDELMKTILEIE